MPTLQSLFGGQRQGTALPESPAQPSLAAPKTPEGIAGSNRYGETEAAAKPLTDQLAGKSLTAVLKVYEPNTDPQEFMSSKLMPDEKTGAFVAKFGDQTVYFKSKTDPPTPESLVVVPLKSLAPAAQGQKQQNVQQQMDERTGLNPAAFGGA